MSLVLGAHRPGSTTGPASLNTARGACIMKKDQIKIGGTYLAKVSDKLVAVRLDAENLHGGWDATNLTTNKKVRIKTAQRLHGEAHRGGETEESGKAAAPAPDGDKPSAKTKAPKKAREPKPKKEKAPGGGGRGMSGLDAAAKILQDADEPLRCKAIVEAIFAKGLWKSDGKTPWATLYSAMAREARDRGAKSRFKKTDRGLFAFNAKSEA